MIKTVRQLEFDEVIKMSLRTDLEKLTDEHWQNVYVKIKPLSTMADVIYAGCDCQLTDEQKDLVNPFGFPLAELIYSGKIITHVLFIMRAMSPLALSS